MKQLKTLFIFICLNLILLPIGMVNANDALKLSILKEEIISPQTEEFDCHSSCIIEVSPDVLCAAWKGGPGKGYTNIDIKKNVGIWVSLSHNGEWSAPTQVVESVNSVCWSPVLVKISESELALFYRIGKDPRHTTSLVKYSFDGGVSWTKEELLPAGIVGPTKAKPVFDRDGNMICGSSVEVGEPDDELKATACWIEILSKSTSQWSKHGPIQIPYRQFGCIEPALFWGEDGILKLVCRDRSQRIGLQGWVWTAESSDGGKTWSELKETTVPNPDSGICVTEFDADHTLLFYNNSHTSRYPLSCGVTTDGGKSWSHLLDLENNAGEFPSATVDSQGLVHVTYAWKASEESQRSIKHVILQREVKDPQ